MKAKAKKGLYIVFEGMVGSGKSTQVKLLADRLKKEFPKKLIVVTKEPGGSEIADHIRKVVQGTNFDEVIEPICEQYLYASSRAQTLRRVVRPNLDKGGIVIADRSFFTSIANQGFGHKLGFKTVMEINKIAVGDMWPYKVILLDVPMKKCLSRLSDGEGDRLETLGTAFYKRVKEGERFLVKKFPRIVKAVNGDREVLTVHEDVYRLVLELVKEKTNEKT